MRYLDPKNDLTFERIFGEHPHLCMSLLNSLLPLDEGQEIVKLSYQTAELLPEIPILKNSLVDVRCTDNRGRQFIVEMQMFWSESFKSRVVFNASKAYVKQLDSAKEYKMLQPVYALSLVNENFENDLEEHYHHYRIVNVHNIEKRIEGLEFVFIELPKFKSKNITEKKLQVLWLRFLTEIHENTTEIPQEFYEEALTKEALQYLENSSYTKDQLMQYDKYWDTVRTERSAYLDAEEKGRKEGIEKGIEKGRKEGRKEGITETMQKVAANALKKGMSIDDIIELTGLSKEEILKLNNY
ncbi:MAG: Rpn family recombination-promoting nuclease/putative transposase [Bacteroidales bacterium]|nr:Rpn family recombination-promoting nuclease/putative transposase [Bacteroidales bacterium]